MVTKRVSRTSKTELGVFKIHTDSHEPMWATTGSACFDLKAYLPVGCPVSVYTSDNMNEQRDSRELTAYDNSGVLINPWDRVLIPTGLIFNIPDNHSIRVHPRSGLSFKSGISLSNCEGVIDSDYVNELYISVINLSRRRVFIGNGERIAQAELIHGLASDKIQINNLEVAPEQKTTRSGGFGHSGK